MNGGFLAEFLCGGCGASFAACPMCVNALRLDPETGLPPDAMRTEDGDLVHNPSPSPEAVARSVKRPVCDVCVNARNEQYLKTATDGDPRGAHILGLWERAEDRHKRNHM